MLTSSLPDLDAGGCTASTPYNPPQSISVEARRLLRRMLIANPARRASIIEIMKSPWFLQDCPEVRARTTLCCAGEGFLCSTAASRPAEMLASLADD